VAGWLIMSKQFKEAQDCTAVDLDVVADIFASLAVAAGGPVMRVYAGGCGVRRKSDHSPVCDADEQAEALILEGLVKALPDIPVIAEESFSRGEVPTCGRAFILVDPVDGTREFLSRNGEFTVNLALIIDGIPRAGAVFAPALERLWVSGRSASRCRVSPSAAVPPLSERELIGVRQPPAEGLIALSSRSHGDADTQAFLDKLPVAECRAAGSSLKFCLIAEGGADVYPRFGPTMEWDTAAGDAILRAAGGRVLSAEGTPMRYGKPNYRNGAFVAWGRAAA
jgi:3'(2'), 5'-bisphosphate nucleotidase